MDSGVKKKEKRRNSGGARILILTVIAIALSAILIRRLYGLQIIDGEYYRNNFNLKTTRTRTLKSTRGNIYDRNGNVLACNVLSYSLTLEDSGSYETNRARALYLNGEAYQISHILQDHGNALSNDFHIVLDEDGNYVFDVTGRSLLRFKADVYGFPQIDSLSQQQRDSTAEEMVEHLSGNGNDCYAIYRSSNPYTSEELSANGLPETLTRQDVLDIIYVRYKLHTTSYRKYLPVTIATELTEESVAALNEASDRLTGIEIVEDSKRIYYDSEAFASLIGYIGRVSSEDLSELQAGDSSYTSESVVGKSGIEKVFESTLKGSDGQETVVVDRLGKVLEIEDESTIQPESGGNVYLTIDRNLQVAVYKILEQRIAGILQSVIVDSDDYDNSDLADTESVRIPILKVYNAIIDNGVLDISHLSDDSASDAERNIESIFENKQAQVFASIKEQLTGENPLPYNELSDEMKEYESYIVNDLLMSETDILSSSRIDKTDETYLAWTRDETISLKDYLTYAASQNWIDISAITDEDQAYMDSQETYTALSEYIESYLSTDTSFSKILYKYLITDKTLTGRDIILALYDQDIFDKNDGLYESFVNESMSSFDLIISKINSLELSPAMLALDPCSGSAVVTDPNTGEILACVSYPGYDNNRLTNTMDVAYYNKLAQDKSGPFYNKATQQETAPGSTYKLITTTAGLEEKAITTDTVFNCTGTFDLTETPLRCWLKSGHGPLNVLGGIQNSCNVFFCNVAYTLGINEEGEWSDSLSLSKQTQYAQLYNMNRNSGIEVPENTPNVSDQYAIQSSIGQGTHAYTTTQLARYVTTLANSGTSYRLSMVDRTTDSDGNVITDYTPEVESTLSISNTTWDTIHQGMQAVIENKEQYADMPIVVAGKTGTAQESKSRPSHALFICYAYAPGDTPEKNDDPTIAMAVRIGNGYSSTNAILTAKDILQYYFGIVDEGEILTGTAHTDSLNSENVD